MHPDKQEVRPEKLNERFPALRSNTLLRSHTSSRQMTGIWKPHCGALRHLCFDSHSSLQKPRPISYADWQRSRLGRIHTSHEQNTDPLTALIRESAGADNGPTQLCRVTSEPPPRAARTPSTPGRPPPRAAAAAEIRLNVWRHLRAGSVALARVGWACRAVPFQTAPALHEDCGGRRLRQCRRRR